MPNQLSPIRPMAAVTLILLLCLHPAKAYAGNCRVTTPAHTTALVELYTSEGCSSCPPADRWLRELGQKFTAQQLVTLSLHVDYWDDIGWPDRFAQHQFSVRQTWLSQISAVNTVYTPEVFSGLRELRGWSNDNVFARRITQINQQPARADITLAMKTAAGNATNIEAQFVLKEMHGSEQGIVLLYEKGLRSEVRAGENKGKTLQHDNVVRYWSAPVALNAARTTWKGKLHLPADWDRQNLSLAALVQDVKHGDVLQVVSMPFCM